MARKNPRRKTESRRSVEHSRPQGQLRTHQRVDNHTLILLVFSVSGLHSLGLASLFSPVVGLFDSQPIVDQDWGLHFHHLKSLEAFWHQDHSLWGYNPFFMAGYPSNTIQDLSIKFFEFLSLALSAVVLSPAQWFKICAFLAMVSVPWIMYGAGRNFFFDDDSRDFTSAAAALLGTIYWWNSLPREMFFYGMVGFAAASYLSIWGVSLLYRMAKQARSFGPVDIGLLLFAVFIIPLHVQSLVMILPPVMALLLTERRFLTVRLLASVILAALLSLLCNSPWLIPAAAHRGDDISEQIVGQLPLFASSDPLTFLKDYLGPKGYWTFRSSYLEKGLRVVLLVLGGLGTWKLLRSDKRYLGITLASALAMLFVITYFGSLMPFTSSWQPLRFKVPYDLFLVIGASYSVGRWLSTRAPAPARIVPILLSGALVAFLVNLYQTESMGRLQLRSRINPELNRIAEWIKREASSEGRVLFEESGDETGFVYDGVYLSSFLPQLTGRQLIGGPINLYNDRHHFAEFHSGRLFKKDIQTLSDEELRNYLRLYNIGAVVAFHPASLQRLQSIPGLVSAAERIGPVHLMKVNQPLTWFLKGEGEVKAGFNRIELSDVKGDEVILKYHWIDGLSAGPAAKIVPVNIADDPIPFIKILEPPPALTLRVGS
jgi:hypothetical protein